MALAYKSNGGGHGGRKNGASYADPGAISKDRKKTEAAIVRTITNKMQAIKKVAVTTDDAGSNANTILYNQVIKMNTAGTGWAITNHLNAFNNKATGAEVWYWAGNNEAKKMAEKLSKTIADTLGITNRGAKATTSLYVHRNTKSGVNVLLIEWCFIDNPADLKKLEEKMDTVVSKVMGVLGYKTTSSSSTSKPSTGFKVGDKVKVVDALYRDSDGAGRSTAKRGQTGTIKRDVGKGKRYLINDWGWAHANDIQKATSGIGEGSTVTLLKTATHYQTGQKINDWAKGKKYKVTDVKNVNQSKSKKAYLLSGINSWVLEQDVK